MEYAIVAKIDDPEISNAVKGQTSRPSERPRPTEATLGSVRSSGNEVRLADYDAGTHAIADRWLELQHPVVKQVADIDIAGTVLGRCPQAR